jgi:hypothetical protein
MRESGYDPEKARALWSTIRKEYPEEWLIMVELLELFIVHNDSDHAEMTEKYLIDLATDKPTLKTLISNSLEVMNAGQETTPLTDHQEL